MNILFVCVANAGRSVMAEYLLNDLAGGRHRARSAGSEPGAAPHASVVTALADLGLDASGHVPRALDAELLAWADIAVSTCNEAVCPVTPGVRRLSWQLADPKNLPVDQVRVIRDAIAVRVRALVDELDTSYELTAK